MDLWCPFAPQKNSCESDSAFILVHVGWSHPYRWGSSQWGFGGNPGVVAKPTKIPLPSGSPVVKIEACTAITAVLLGTTVVYNDQSYG
jgi:hypothetical protein